ncbi:hypothetical protein Mapa_008999 [Marchantia paleacea]|nr:hypothetical protein Mapa_008999 [Marchantia paleacea]
MEEQRAAEPLLPVASPPAGDQRITMSKVKTAALLTSPWLLLALVVVYHRVDFSGTPRGVQDQIVTLTVEGADPGRNMSETLFGIFFEEINHAGAGGLWAELINNRGFEAGGQNTPSSIDPWSPLGKGNETMLTTERASLFPRNPIALRMKTLCGNGTACPPGGVGVANPGYWGIDVQAGKSYQITFWLRSDAMVNLSVAFISQDELRVLAQQFLIVDEANSYDWQKYQFNLVATDTDHYGKLAFTTSVYGSIWLDQVSAFPGETYKGHGFRKELAEMLEELKPAFLRFPGGCYVEGERLQNAWRWRDTIGPWEERPGHYGDVWNYWSDDGLGYFEFLQLAEDLNTAPVWVFNNGISHSYSISPRNIQPWVQDALDGLEFATGPNTSTYGAIRAAMGHPEPFNVRHVAIGNEDCWKPYYQENYMAFYKAIKLLYPYMGIISNCDATNGPLKHPADLYDFHIYTNANNLYAMKSQFDQKTRDSGPKVFVSEYAVTGSDSGTGSLLAAIAEGAFMIGLEKNSDVVEMASYAPLFVHEKDRRWNPDAIVFNSWQQYGTPSYWVQTLFKHSSGAKLLGHSVTGANGGPTPVVSAIRRHDTQTNGDYLVIKAVNFGKDVMAMRVVFNGIPANGIAFPNSTIAILSSDKTMDENSFSMPEKIMPQVSNLAYPESDMQIMLPPYSIVALDLRLNSSVKLSPILQI